MRDSDKVLMKLLIICVTCVLKLQKYDVLIITIIAPQIRNIIVTQINYNKELTYYVPL